MPKFASVFLARPLGRSDLRISPVGIGAWALGGPGWQYSLGKQDDKQSIALIHCALDLGINWIDTAPLYGLGHSEALIGRALRTAPSKPLMFTKCGVRWRADGSLYHSLRAASLTEEVESSLRRLRVDVIDLCQVHWPRPESQIEEAMETLGRLREQGKIRWIGVSNFSVGQTKRAMHVAPISSVQPIYSLLRRREAERNLLPFAQAHGMGVIGYSALAHGLLAGSLNAAAIAGLPPEDCRRDIADFREPRLSRNLSVVGLLRQIAAGHGVAPAVIAVAWALRHPAITGIIVGPRNTREMEELAPALELQLSQHEYDQIRRFTESLAWRLRSFQARIADLARRNANQQPPPAAVPMTDQPSQDPAPPIERPAPETGPDGEWSPAVGRSE